MAATDKEKKYPDWWYQSANQKELDSLAGQIASRPDFKFKVDHEALYDYYKGEYDRQGREAKLDTEAKGAALTGGYGNSYARQAGQQAYEEQVEGLQENVAPDLWQMALDKYTREGKALVDRYSALQKQEKEDYEAWEEEHADEIEALQRQQEQQKAAASAVDRIAGKNNRYDPMAQYTGQRVDQITTEKTTKDPGQVAKDLSWEGYRATMDAAIGKVTGKQDFYDSIPETPQYVDSPLYIQKLPTAEELRDGLVPYEALAKVPDFLAQSNYEPKDVGSRLTRQEMEGMSDEQQDKYFAAFNSDSSQEDLLYEAVNGNYLALLALNSNGYEIFDGLDEKYRMTPSELMHMSAEEISIFNYVYKALGLDAAKGYLNYLADYLSARQRQAVQTAAANRAEKQPFLSSVDTIITSPFRGQIASVGVLSDLADDGKLRTNADYNMLDYQANAVRGKVSEMIEKQTPFGKVGSFVYGAGMSIGDSLARMVTSAGNPFLSAQLAACSAGVSTISLAKNLGLNDGQALALGVIAGFAEGFFEKHNLEDLLNADLMKDGKLKYILKNALNETTEEVSTELVNTVADIILAWDKGQMRTAIDAYKAQGMDAGQASLHAFCDKLLEIGEAGLVGALTGGIMSGSNVALNSIVSMAYKKSSPTQAARQPYTSTDAPAVNMPGTELSEGLQDVETKADSPAAAWDQAVRQYVQGEQAASTATIQEVQTVESNAAKAENGSLKEASKKYGAQAAMMENAYQQGQDVERFDREYKLAYDMGKEGASRELLDDGAFAYLTAEQKNTAYQSGAAAVSGYQEGRNAQGQRKRGTVKGYGVDVKAMAQAFNVNQAYAYKAIAQIADVTGVDVVLFESKPDANGELRGGVIDGIDMSNAQGAFSWHNNKIYIDINAGVLRGADMGDVAKYSMLRTFTHEFTHFIEKHNAKQYDAFRELVFDTMRRNGTDPDALIQAYMDRHEGTTRDAASREVVAEAMTDILPQSRFVEELAQKHEGIFKSLRNKLKNFVKRIKAYFKSIGSNQSAEVAAVAQYMDGALRYAQEIVDAFDRVAVQAVENYQADQVAQKNTAPEGGVQMQIRESFYKEFDAWDKKNANITFVTGTTSDALKSIGMKDQEIILRSGTVLQKLKDHPEMTYDIFRNIPDLLEHPIIVQFSDAIDTKTQRPKYESSITVLGELYADVKEDGKTVKKPVLVSLELLPTNQKKTAVLDFAIIKSAYSKNALQQYINENSILYIDPDKKRTNSWLSLNRLQLPLGENRYGSVRKITYADGKVKVQNAKNMTAMQRALQAAGIVDAYGNQQSTKEKAEQHQERKGTITNRDIIAQIEGKTELEREKLQEYQDILNKAQEQSQIAAQKQWELDELLKAEGPKDGKKVLALKEDVMKAKNRRSTYEGMLHRMETGILSVLIEREKGPILEKLRNTYGTIPKGEKAVRDDSLPVSVDGKTKVSRTARTVKGAGVTPDEFADLIDTEVVKGGLSYVPITNDKTTQEAVEWISNEGWEMARAKWHTEVQAGKTGADLVARGALLLNNAAKAGDKNAWLDILHDYQFLGTKTAQGMQAMKILKKLAPEDKLYTIKRSIAQMVKDMKLGFEITLDPELEAAYRNAKTAKEAKKLLAEIQQSVADQIPSTWMDKWTALRYLNMLGNLRTQIRNLAGNTGMMLVTGTKDAVAVGLEQIAYAASGGQFRKTKSLVVSGEMLKAARADYELVESIIQGGGKYSDSRNESMEFARAVREKQRIFRSKLGLPLELYRKGTNWAMEKGDVFFSKIAYAKALAGYLKANGVKDGDFSEVDTLLMNEARLYAVQEAQEATFRDTNALSKWVSSLGRKDTTWAPFRTISEGVMPFRKTPANVLVRAEEYSPLGIVNSLYTSIRAMQKGSEVTGAQVINSWAKTLTGTGLFALGMLLQSLGVLVGGPDEDDDLDRFEDLNGQQNYALKFGDVYITIDWLSPMAMPLFMGGQTKKLMEEGGIQFKDVEKVLTSIADPMIQMSMLQGVNDTLENVRYAENNMGQLLINAAVSYLTQGLTNTLLGQMERGFEEQRMSTYVDKNSAMPDWMQKALGKASAKIPGWDYNQIPYINAWGQEEQNPAPWQNLPYNMLSPSYVSQGQEDAVSQELTRLNEVQSDVNVFPSTPEKKYDDRYLSSDEYVALAKAQGQTQRQIVEGMVGSELYEGLPDTYKAKAIELAYGYARESAQIEVLGRDGFTSDWMAELGEDTAQGILKHVIGENIKSMYLGGDITAEEAVKRRMEYHGDTEDEAKEKVAYWEFQNANPQYADWSQDTVTKYKDLEPDTAAHVIEVLGGLSAEDGYTNVRPIQKLEAIASDRDLSAKDKETALRANMDSKLEAKYDTARDMGISMGNFVKAYRKYQDTSGEGKKATVIAYYKKTFGISNSKAEKLYDLFVGKKE